MEKVSAYSNYNPFDTLTAAAPLGLLRPPTLSPDARGNLLRQAVGNLSQLQGEWDSRCVAPSSRSIYSMLRLLQVVSIGISAIPVAVGTITEKWNFSPSEIAGSVLSVVAGTFGFSIAQRAIRNTITVERQNQAVLEKSTDCIQIREQIADATAAIAELEGGQKKLPNTPFPHRLRVVVTDEAVAKVSLAAAIGAALVYGAKAAASSLAGFASCLTPRSFLENMGAQPPDII